jgi:hypothetical protein
MDALSYALVTPSFRLDLERCTLLVDSVDRWVAPEVKHYLVIDRRDVALFRPLLSARTQLIVVEEIIPSWVVRIPGFNRFWLSFRTRPLKNWILQQLVKLSIPDAVTDDVLLYTDSDVLFVNPYNPSEYTRDGRTPLFVEYGQKGLIVANDQWHQAAATMLGLTPGKDYDTNFIDNLVPWRRRNVLDLHARMQEVAGRDWELVVASQNRFSEYILYGLFCQNILGDRSGHWDDTLLRSLSYWGTTPLTVDELTALRGRLQPQHRAVMISAKSHTDISAIRQVFLPK